MFAFYADTEPVRSELEGVVTSLGQLRGLGEEVDSREQKYS